MKQKFVRDLAIGTVGGVVGLGLSSMILDVSPVIKLVGIVIGLILTFFVYSKY